MIDLDALRSIVKTRITSHRIVHTLCVEREADALAWRWGADRVVCRAAALLHDITKDLTLDAQLKLCKKCDIVTTHLETGKLLHAMTGAALARHEFEMPENVVTAVRWHTTGRAGMSTEEKIIYLADYVDSTRRFDGVADLRRLAFNNLDAACLLGFDISIRNQLDNGNPICPATIQARNALLVYE